MVTGLTEAAENIKPGCANEDRTLSRITWLLPVAFALFAGLWALRGVGTNNIVDTDAARHAMNGVFVRDLVASGQWAKPVEFGRYYYGRLPALSMPYHPPFFPVVEAFFFQVFGVSVLTARILVALFTAGALLLLCVLIRRTHGSVAVAVATVATFYAWRFTQVVASDTMLEFPSLLMAVTALLCFHRYAQDLSIRWALAFTIIAGAAVWTKQHAVFLGAVPFAYIVFVRRFQMLKSAGLWIASVLYAVQVLALNRLSQPFENTGPNQVAPSYEIVEIIVHNFGFYWDSTVHILGLPGALILAASTIAALITTIYRPDRELSLYLAWASCAFGVLLLLGPYDPRYMFYVYPPLAVITYDMLGRATGLLPHVRPSYVPVAAAIFFLAVTLRAPANYLTGPAEAAATVLTRSSKRVLYCGSTDGNFVFAVRALDPSLATTVIVGEKLPDEWRVPAAFDQFVQRYAVTDVVIEHTGRAQACDAIRLSPPSSLEITSTVPLTSSLPRWDGGSLSIYRVNRHQASSQETLTMPVPKIGTSVEVKF